MSLWVLGPVCFTVGFFGTLLPYGVEYVLDRRSGRRFLSR